MFCGGEESYAPIIRWWLWSVSNNQKITVCKLIKMRNETSLTIIESCDQFVQKIVVLVCDSFHVIQWHFKSQEFN